MKKLTVKITFLDEVLGTASNDPNIHEEFIASKAPDALSRDEEILALGVDEVIEKNKTVFPRSIEGDPILYDYQIKGFFKDSCSMLARLKNGNEASKLKAYKKVIDGLIFIEPRMIPFEGYGEIGFCQRPLRAQTAQGERIALANSETVPEGSTVSFSIILMDNAHETLVRELLDYGRYRGIGQWRNSGKGRFTWEEL